MPEDAAASLCRDVGEPSSMIGISRRCLMAWGAGAFYFVVRPRKAAAAGSFASRARTSLRSERGGPLLAETGYRIIPE
jgi:hypothetical protein